MNNMKKIIIFSLVLITMAAAAGIVVARDTEKTSDENSRYLIKSNNSFLKIMYGVNHSFDNGFTTNLTPGQLKVLKKFGVEMEEVKLYHILAPPGACSPWPECRSTEDPNPGPEERSCYPSTQKPYGITMVNGSSGGVGVNVAVLDTGALTTHLDLDVKMCKDATKRKIKDGCSDIDGHGTHVAGTIAANGGSDGLGIFGVAPEANLWAIKVCGLTGCWADDIAAGIRYATDQGVNIISMSLGGDTESLLIKDAIDYAVGKDVLIVVAAGNDGPENGSIDYPAANAKVIAVGAIDSAKIVPSWSSRGINDGDYVIEEKEVEF
ncbi:MAG: S8 family serine peptidase, partial [bacterium]